VPFSPADRNPREHAVRESAPAPCEDVLSFGTSVLLSWGEGQSESPCSRSDGGRNWRARWSVSDLPRQLTFLSGQLLDASSDCTEGEQRSA
jgi:hypothetical protein